jgi:hypothetical protein
MKRMIIVLLLFLTGSAYSQVRQPARASIDVLQSPITLLYGFTDTTSVVPDTLTRRIFEAEGTYNHIKHKFRKWYKVNIVADDTIQVSKSANFTAGEIIVVFPLVPYTTGILEPSVISNLYYKRYDISGANGVPNVYIRVEGD